ncbi:MAG: insulinase family protein [Kofleriaceae bacterium]|jgi:zinc protease|nr:insulinase family protein [Kofleriaceae bacterium]MBP6839516.1 insulinase family protein [Kofleriaceae bacterium]MBP9208024.1 insulinase family protein [Kofleriaceae bacterium]
MIGSVRGAPLFVEPAGDTPLVWFDISIGGGASADPMGIEGSHRHAALLARRGAGGRDRAALDEALDALGANVDVALGRDAVTVSGLCLSKNLDAVVDLVADILAAPRFDQDEHARLLRETPQILDEIRDDDSALATRWFDWACCPGHPYGRTSLGTEASLAGIELAAVAAQWRAEVVPRNLVIGVAGDVTPGRGEALAGRLVERLVDGAAPAQAALGTTSTSARRLYLVDKADRTQAQLRLGHLSARFGEPDTAALLIAETAFGGMFSSRLMQEIRVKRGWSYGAGCALRRSRGRHWFEMWMATAIEVAAPAVALTHELYAELAERGPRADEIELARSYLLGAMPFHTATARQRMQLAVRDAVFGLPPGYSAELPRAVGAITADEVRAACQRHLHPDQLVTVAVTTAADTHAGFDQAGLGPISTVRFDEY